MWAQARARLSGLTGPPCWGLPRAEGHQVWCRGFRDQPPRGPAQGCARRWGPRRYSHALSWRILGAAPAPAWLSASAPGVLPLEVPSGPQMGPRPKDTLALAWKPRGPAVGQPWASCGPAVGRPRASRGPAVDQPLTQPHWSLPRNTCGGLRGSRVWGPSAHSPRTLTTPASPGPPRPGSTHMTGWGWRPPSHPLAKSLGLCVVVAWGRAARFPLGPATSSSCWLPLCACGGPTTTPGLGTGCCAVLTAGSDHRNSPSMALPAGPATSLDP